MARRRFSETALRRKLREHGDCCAECGGPVGGAAGLEWDHVIPLELGGADEIENLQPLCRSCHKAKTGGHDVPRIAKAKRSERRTLGIKKTSRRPLLGSKASGWKQKLDGSWVRR